MKSEIPITEPEKINIRELMDYYHLKGVLGALRLRLKIAKNMFLQTLAEFSPTPSMAVMLQRMKGVKVGKHVYIGPKTFIDILYPQLVTIEDYVSIGYSMIFVHSNPTNSYLIKAKIYPRIVMPVTIKKGAWVAAGCKILPGVTIGEHAIVGANSLVNKDIPSKHLAVGNPAKVIRELNFE